MRRSSAWLFLLVACGEEVPVPEGVECSPDLYASPSGCFGRYCAACSDASECQPLEACNAGTCGRCTDDASCRSGRSCIEGFCVESDPPVWKLEIAEPDLLLLMSDPYAEIFVPCVLEAEGTRYDEGCRIRIRGGSSRDYPKRSFRITFPEDAPHPGFSRKINLRAEYNDPTFLRSVAANEIFARFTRIPTPDVRFIRLEINGEPYGLMLEVERVGKRFLRENGRSETSLYEADPGHELFASGGGSLIPLPDEETYRSAYPKSVGTAFDYSDLIALIEMLAADFDDGGAASSVRASFQTPALLDYLAVMAVVQNLDHVRKNYYLSPQADGWEIYPWDLDLTFGCLYDEEGRDTICDRFTHTAPAFPGRMPPGVFPEFPLEGHFNLLIHLALEDAELGEGARCRACAILDSPFWTKDLEALLSASADGIEPFVREDARDLNGSIDEWRAVVEEMKTFAARRAEHLRSELGCAP